MKYVNYIVSMSNASIQDHEDMIVIVSHFSVVKLEMGSLMHVSDFDKEPYCIYIRQLS